ncbi:MAG TPA: ATP-binding protein [Sulfuricaulis sp.]
MRWLPSTLSGRLVLVLLGGLLLAQLLGAAILLRDRATALYEASGLSAAQRIASIVHVFDTLTPEQRRLMLSAVNTAGLQVALGESRAAKVVFEDGMFATHLRAVLLRALGDERALRVAMLEPGSAGVEPGPKGPPIGGHMGGPHMGGPHMGLMAGLPLRGASFLVQAQLKDGHWVSFAHRLPEEPFTWPYKLLLTLAVLLVSVIALSLLAVRWLTRPLGVLAVAADELGRDIRRAPLVEEGPVEVRRAAAAFNTMQARLQTYLREREQMLAAVSHDLRTPITRLRLRAELIEDESLRAKFARDLAEMEAMTVAALDFLRGVRVDEAVQPVDVLAMLESLQADMEEAGHEVQVRDHAVAPYLARPLALKRCLTNLAENAVRYGTRAEMGVEDDGRELRITVADDGPGIPEAELKRVFEPFYRIEGSRSRETGGVGLGLSVARDIARAHRGELILRNRPGGGLEAVLTLPR